jgi:ATP-dependent DNA helicase RecG
MTKDELLDLLRKHEWRDIECKAAREKCPKDAWSTVSAFANTKGGHLLLGVKKDGGNYELVKMINLDETQGTLISTLRSTQKFSIPIEFEEELHDLKDGLILSFYIHEADRNDKPVYVTEDKSRIAYIRKGGEDCRANEVELARWVRDASAMTWDSVPMNISSESFFDEKAVRWFRRVLDRREQDRYADLSDVDFLHEMGLLNEEQNQVCPTRAAVLLFGKARYVRQLLPRPVVDYFRFDRSEVEVDEDRRWQDRLTLDENLVNAWRALVDRYAAQAERPFTGVDSTTLRRRDDPPDFVAFREAVINLLAHQDYGDHGRLPTIKFFRDRWLFHNPGDAFDSVEELLEQGAKQLRNPAIMTAFRRIGLSDQAGTGVRSIYKNWRSLQYFPPVINNNKVNKTFMLTLVREHLPLEWARQVEVCVGVQLTNFQADLLAFACENEGAISLLEGKTVGLASGRETSVALEHMASQGFLVFNEEDSIWTVPEQLTGVFRDAVQATEQARSLISDQAGNKTDQPSGETPQVTPQVGDTSQATSQATSQVLGLTDRQFEVMSYMESPKAIKKLMEEAGFQNRRYFLDGYIQQLVGGGFIASEYPQPNHPQQRYLLTDKGREALKRHREGGQ